MFKAEKTKRIDNPVKDAMFLSRLFFIWLKDIFRMGMKRTLEDQDMYESLDEHKSTNLAEYFSILWNDELKRSDGNPSVVRILLKAYGPQIILSSLLFSTAETILSLLQTICLGGLVSYFAPNQTEISKDMAYVYATGISITTVMKAINFHPFIFYVLQQYLKIRNGLSSLIYKKVLRLSKSNVFDGMNGKVINMLSNDVSKLEYGIAFVHDLWMGPSEVIIIGYYLYLQVGKSAIITLIFLISFIPLQMWMAKRAASYNLRAAKRTDVRVKFMNEIIQGIQVIKMYAWEKSFAKMVDTIRRKELKIIRGIYFVEGILNSFFTVSRISIFVCLMTLVYFGEPITASKVFIVTSCLLTLNSSITYFWPVALTEGGAAWVSVKRIEQFLKTPEESENEKMVEVEQNRKIPNGLMSHGDEGNEKGIYLRDVSATWLENESGIFSIDLKVKLNNLCAVIGLVGSGKTTLLNAIIGELPHKGGNVNINGTLSYASQEPWLFSGTIRQNILFIEEFDEIRYREVCRVCALDRDFELWPFGDLTMTGERGVILSGGQRARVSLARAIYRRADIYLLDDPLSAVDAHVGKQIFTECIQKFLKEKCVILVTHQIQYLKNVKHIVLMDNGKIDAQGNFEDLQKLRENILGVLSLELPNEGVEDTFQVNKLQSPTNIIDGEVSEEQESKENLIEGSVSFKVYKSYVNSIKSGFTLLSVTSFFIVSQVSYVAVDFFLAKWANWEEEVIRINDTVNSISNTTDLETYGDSEIRLNYVIVYTAICGILVYTVIQRNIIYFKACLRASANLHNQLFQGISRATMSFFNKNPSGRILNRFSKDIGAIDSRLPLTLMETLNCFMEMFSIGMLVSVMNPWLIFPTVTLSLLLYGLRIVYVRTSRSINRIQSLNNSPVFAHVNATIQGLSTVRAFKAQHALNEEFNRYMNNLTRTTYMFYATRRAFALWLDTICSLYTVTVTMGCLLFSENALGGDVGLIITKSILLIGLSQWGIRQSAELENHMVSVERINEYSQVNPEPLLETHPSTRKPVGWPEYGSIKFQSLSLKYSEDGPYVLKNLNFNINAKEKVGVVGRTGAGKSSLIQALFRLTKVNGDIEIDGVNITELGLHDLRKNISIIPQEPVLFSGTMRSNLDPFDEKSDIELWHALEQVQLKHVVGLLAGGLDSKMSDGGSNFSMGQRQLVCLARAILRNNRILILDEATANVDSETDKLIQTTIRNTFRECTVITIAHRLHTVMDNDRILVMDGGQVVEFDSPAELLKRENGFLSKLAKQSEVR